MHGCSYHHLSQKVSALGTYIYWPPRLKDFDDKLSSFPGISDGAYEIVKSSGQFPVRCYGGQNYMADAVRNM